MPQLGETVTEGTITRWMKSIGDQVERDEPLFEVSTDKVDTEVPSPAAGVLTEIVVPEGETVDVGTRLAVIGDGQAGSSGVTAEIGCPGARRSAGTASASSGRTASASSGPTAAASNGRTAAAPTALRPVGPG